MKMITSQEVKDRLVQILETAHDAEKAHSMADDLKTDALYTIGQNMFTHKEEMALLALEVLRVDAIDFERWCA